VKTHLKNGKWSKNYENKQRKMRKNENKNGKIEEKFAKK